MISLNGADKHSILRNRHLHHKYPLIISSIHPPLLKLVRSLWNSLSEFCFLNPDFSVPLSQL